MKGRARRWLLVLLCGGLLIALVLLWRSEPGSPVALIRVVDAAGKPVPGAVIQADGLRTKAGPYEGGHYGWPRDPAGVPNTPVSTDAAGVARVPYPRYVFERIETGQISFSVQHPDFVPDRPFRVIATAPPARAPLRAWFDYMLNRLRLKTLIARPDPVVLQRGAVLRLSSRTNPNVPTNSMLFAQASGARSEDTNFWSRPEPGVVVTRRLAAGPGTVRAVTIEPSGAAWFSDVIDIVAASEQTNDVVVELRRGATVRGRLDDTVPRPVADGRVIAHVWPRGRAAQSAPPDWHAWAPIRDDGSFEIGALPEGDLEVVALCRGFVSVVGPGQHRFRYPQKHVLTTNELEITVAMEPTARLEVTVMDDQGRPVEGAKVSTWPNVRYGEWSATILASDLYNTRDLLLKKPESKSTTSPWSVPDFEGTSDGSGVAVLPNLPSEVTSFSLVHTQFALPVVTEPGGEKHRSGKVVLTAGRTNRVTVQVEPSKRSTIAHY